MKLTAATAKKIAREKGISISMVSAKTNYGVLDLEMIELPADVIERNLENPDSRGNGGINTVEVARLLKKYNRQVKKIVAALRIAGFFMWGRRFGNGEWVYAGQEPSCSERLAMANID